MAVSYSSVQKQDKFPRSILVEIDTSDIAVQNRLARTQIVRDRINALISREHIVTPRENYVMPLLALFEMIAMDQGDLERISSHDCVSGVWNSGARVDLNELAI